MKSSKYLIPALSILAFSSCNISPAVSREPVDYNYVSQIAKTASNESYSEPKKFENDLTFSEYGQITFNPAKNLWRYGNLPYRLEFFHLGYIYNSPVTINEFKGAYSQELRFTNDLFNFGNLDEARVDYAKKLNRGYSGFKILCQLNRPGNFDELISFLGNSKFRALGRYNVYGAYAATFLTIGTDGGIDFGHFSDFWLGKPNESDTSLIIYSLADSESAISAFKYEITQGDVCSIKVTQTIYPREEILTLGIAPIASVFLYDAATQKDFGSYYPEMHFSDIFIFSADGNNICQNLDNYKKPVVSEFEAKNLNYFGLLQRDRNYQNYQTPFLAQHMMPNLWIVPSKWTEGKLRLIQMPTKSIDMLNVYAFWTPAEKLTPGKPYTYEYTMFWGMTEPSLPPNPGKAVELRIGSTDSVTTFYLKFSGDQLTKLPAVTALQPNIVINGNARLFGSPQILKDPFDNSWRVIIPVSKTDDPSKSNIVTINCTLMNEKTPVTETWSYKWTL